MLEMAFNAENLITLHEHAGVDRTMHGVAGGAAFTHRFMFENEGSALGRVAFAASIAFDRERGSPADDSLALMRVMTIPARNLALQHRMMVREVEFTPFVQVTLKTSVRRFARINNCLVSAAGLVVNAARPVTRFAADILRVRTWGF